MKDVSSQAQYCRSGNFRVFKFKDNTRIRDLISYHIPLLKAIWICDLTSYTIPLLKSKMYEPLIGRSVEWMKEVLSLIYHHADRDC